MKKYISILLILTLFFSLRLPQLVGSFLVPFASLSFSPSTSSIKYITNDTSTLIPITITATSSSNKPLEAFPLSLKASNALTPKQTLVYTDHEGHATFYFSLDDAKILFNKSSLKVELIFSDLRGQNTIKKELLLVHKPVCLVHGFQKSYSNLTNLVSYLQNKSIDISIAKYNFTSGVLQACDRLSKKIDSILLRLQKKGYYLQKVDLISYSMGGLVTRVYTTSTAYKNNVSSITFLSGANNGSYLADIGAYIYQNKSIEDLKPNSYIVSKLLPSGINGGLNPDIPVANAIGKNDEVISLENVSLEKWDIPTVLFDIGKSNITFDNLINGKLTTSTVHNNILNNRFVFDWIYENINSQLPSPKPLFKP